MTTRRDLLSGAPAAGALLVLGFGTPRREVLVESPPAEVLDYLAFLVDPPAAGDRRVTVTISVGDDPAIHRMQLRNGVLIRSAADSPGPIHVAISPEALADFVPGAAPLPGDAPDLADFAQVFDRSHFIDRDALVATLNKTPTYPH